MISPKTRKIIPVLMLLLVFINSIAPTFATGLSASPAEFKYNITTSKTVTGQVIVTNIGNNPVNVVVENKRLLKDSTHLIYSDNGIANWISVGLNNFTLAPKESKTVPFTLTTPSQINYYDAVGALVIRALPSQSDNNTDKPKLLVTQGVELVIPLIVGLPGHIIESLQLLDHKAPTVLLSFIPGDFIYQLNNNGTVYANMTGNIEINGLLSSHKVPIQGGVYPEDNYTLQTQWTPGFLDLGLYSADTNINYGRYQQTKTLQTHDTILVIPVWLIFIILLALGFWIIRKKGIESPVKIKVERKK